MLLGVPGQGVSASVLKYYDDTKHKNLRATPKTQKPETIRDGPSPGNWQLLTMELT